MWTSGVVSIPTARLLAAEIRKKKRLAFHVLSLERSAVTAEVLDKSDLELALGKHADHPGIGRAIRELLVRFLYISWGREDRVNKLFEANNWASPFQNPFMSRTVPRDSESEWEESESEFSGSESEDEYPASFEGYKKEYEKNQLEKLAGAKKTEKNAPRKRKYSDLAPIAQKLSKLGPTIPLPSPSILPPLSVQNDVPPKSEKDLNLAVEQMLSKIKTDLGNKPMEAVKEPKRREKEPKVKKEQKKRITSEKKEGKVEKIALKIANPAKSNTKILEKQKKEPKVKKEKKKDRKEEKRLEIIVPIDKMTNFPEKANKSEKEKIPERKALQEMKPNLATGSQNDPALSLAQKLNALPLNPKKEEVLELIKNLTPELLTAAEKNIGRKMRRVDFLWWQMLVRDFGPFDPATSAGDVRDIYAAKQLFARRRNQRILQQTAAPRVNRP